MSNETELFAHMLDGTADAEDQAAFEALLATDAAARRRWLLEARFESDLRRLAGARAQRHDAGVTSARLNQQGPGSRRRRGPRPHGRRALLMGTGLTAVLVVSLLAGLVLWRQTSTTSLAPEIGMVTRASGGAVIGADGVELPAGIGTPLRVGDSLRAPLDIALSDGSQLTLMGGTLRLGQQGGGHSWRVDRGMLSVKVAPQPEPLTIRTAQATVAVVGTAFDLLAGTTATDLMVHEGIVRLHSHAGGEALTVGTGEAGQVVGDGLATRRLPGRRVADWAFVAPTAAPGWTGRPTLAGLHTIVNDKNATADIPIRHVISPELPQALTPAGAHRLVLTYSVPRDTGLTVTTVHSDAFGWAGNLHRPYELRGGSYQQFTVRIDELAKAMGDPSRLELLELALDRFSLVVVQAEDDLVFHQIALERLP